MTAVRRRGRAFGPDWQDGGCKWGSLCPPPLTVSCLHEGQLPGDEGQQAPELWARLSGAAVLPPVPHPPCERLARKPPLRQVHPPVC